MVGFSFSLILLVHNSHSVKFLMHFSGTKFHYKEFDFVTHTVLVYRASSSSSSSVGPVANATDVLQPSTLIVLTLSPRLLGRSHVRHQVPPRPQRHKRS